MPPPMSTRTNAKLRAANGVALISPDWIVDAGSGMAEKDVTRRASPSGTPHALMRVPASRPGRLSKCSGSSAPVASRRAYVNWLAPVSKLSAW